MGATRQMTGVGGLLPCVERPTLTHAGTARTSKLFDARSVILAVRRAELAKATPATGAGKKLKQDLKDHNMPLHVVANCADRLLGEEWGDAIDKARSVTLSALGIGRRFDSGAVEPPFAREFADLAMLNLEYPFAHIPQLVDEDHANDSVYYMFAQDYTVRARPILLRQQRRAKKKAAKEKQRGSAGAAAGQKRKKNDDD